MKLLIFCPYYPPHVGGLESHADEFNKYLSQEGMDITVFTPMIPTNSPAKEIVHNKVKVIRFPAFEIISNYPLPKFWDIKFWKLFFELFKTKPNIVISRTRFFFTSLLALVYAKIKRVRWIHIEHGSDFVKLSSKFKSFIAKIYDYTLGLLIFRLSDQNIAISQAVNEFIKKFDNKSSKIIYRGLNFQQIDRIQPDNEIKKKYKNKLIITFVGRLYKWKGVENSVSTINSLPKEIKEKIIFLIIGNGEDFERLKQISDDSTKMVGSVSRDKAIGILKSSDIYLHSSLPGGGLSTSLLEAMYCGCAVIATPNEGAKEVIENKKNGFLTDFQNQAELTEKITELVSNIQLKKNFGIKAKNHIKDNFQWEKAINSYELILQNER